MEILDGFRPVGPTAPEGGVSGKALLHLNSLDQGSVSRQKQRPSGEYFGHGFGGGFLGSLSQPPSSTI